MRSAWVLVGLAAIAGGAAAVPAGWHTYSDPKLGYAVSYPPDWKFEKDGAYSFSNPTLKGIAIHVPVRMTDGTNLSENSRFSVETLPGSNCTPAQFASKSADPIEGVHSLKADGRSYTAALSDDPYPGHDDKSYLFVIKGTCIAVRYLVVASDLGAYDPGTVRAFDNKKLMALFDSIRATLTLKK
jgi:hypothetical protein